MLSLLQSFGIRWQPRPSPLSSLPHNEASDPELAARLARAAALQERAERCLRALETKDKQSTRPA